MSEDMSNVTIDELKSINFNDENSGRIYADLFKLLGTENSAKYYQKRLGVIARDWWYYCYADVFKRYFIYLVNPNDVGSSARCIRVAYDGFIIGECPKLKHTTLPREPYQQYVKCILWVRGDWSFAPRLDGLETVKAFYELYNSHMTRQAPRISATIQDNSHYENRGRSILKYSDLVPIVGSISIDILLRQMLSDFAMMDGSKTYPDQLFKILKSVFSGFIAKDIRYQSASTRRNRSRLYIIRLRPSEANESYCVGITRNYIFLWKYENLEEYRYHTYAMFDTMYGLNKQIVKRFIRIYDFPMYLDIKDHDPEYYDQKKEKYHDIIGDINEVIKESQVNGDLNNGNQ